LDNKFNDDENHRLARAMMLKKQPQIDTSFSRGTAFKKVGDKDIPVTVRGGPYGWETLRLPHFLDNQVKDGCDVVSFTLRAAALYPPPTPHEDSWYSFLLEAESTTGP
jgi:hypothetical protein